MAKKPDAILVAPTDTKAMIPPLTQAKQAGSKLVFVDTTTENGAELAESEIASDNEEGGREAARTLAKLTGEKGSVLVIKETGTGFVVVTKENMNDPDVQPFLYKSSC